MAGLVGMVLCAGLGTRLRPLTESVPKPAVPVCGVPLIRFNLALLKRAGATRAVVNVHHLAEPMAEAARAAAAAVGLPLEISREPVIAGTGGALREARALLAGAEAVAVVNGDLLFDVDLAEALAVHRQFGGLATMVLAPMPEGARYATVETDGAGAVRRIAGRFGPGGDGLSPWHFTGVHVLSPGLFAHLPAEPFEVDVNRHVYPPLMERGLVRAHLGAGYWNDLGTPARYLEACGDVLAGRLDAGRFPGCDPFAGFAELAAGVRVHASARFGADAVLRAPCAVGPGARVDAGATIGPAAFVGAGASVGRGATVRDAVLWDGTAVDAAEVVERQVAAGALRVSSAEPA